MPNSTAVIPAEIREDVETLWNYHQMGHEVRPTDIGIGLGSHDIGVAMIGTDLYHRGMYPILLFTGANAPPTVEVFPRGEAVHYREYALAHGVPDEAILIETKARHTAENIVLSRELLEERGYKDIKTITLMSRPYQQRRGYSICKKHWPEVEVICASHPLPIDDYFAFIGNAKKRSSTPWSAIPSASTPGRKPGGQSPSRCPTQSGWHTAASWQPATQAAWSEGSSSKPASPGLSLCSRNRKEHGPRHLPCPGRATWTRAAGRTPQGLPPQGSAPSPAPQCRRHTPRTRPRSRPATTCT